MTIYQETGVRLTNTQLNKVKSSVSSKTGTILIINKKKVEDEKWLHELFITIRQTTKIGNAFTNDMTTDIKLSKDQLLKQFSQVDILVLGQLI